jgi:dipeptidyl aminopeptidase/acylaminoacyl peptidase
MQRSIAALLAVFAMSCAHGKQPIDTAECPPTEATTVSPSGKVANSVAAIAPVPNIPTKWVATARAADDPMDAAKQPFGLEEYYLARRVLAPSYSPDSSMILFNLASYDMPRGKSEMDIYRVNADGSDLRRLTRFEGLDFGPIWTPDGKSFYFVSTREKGAQLWKMPIDGGEPKKITNISTGISQPTISADGKKLVFSSSVYPEYGADDAKNKALNDDIEGNPLQAHLADHLLYRHWTSWADGTRSHILVFNLEDSTTIDATPGDFESPVFGGSFDVSPKSDEICFASNREDPDAQAWTTNSDIWVVPMEGGKAKNLTESNKAYDGSPRYSPDGRYIAFERQLMPGYESDRFRITLYDRQSGDIKILTEKFDNQIMGFHWAANSKTIIFHAQVEGRFPLYKIEIENAEISMLPVPSVRAFDMADNGAITFTHNSVATPDELFSLDPASGEIIKMTSFNKAISDKYDIRPVEEIWVEGPDDGKIHTFIVKPHGFNPAKKYPLIINVHGGPQYQWADSFRGDWQVYPAAGYVVAFPNPHGSTGYGHKYTEAISKDWGGKVYNDVMAVTDHLAKLNYVDEDNMGAMGWSYGGYFMNWLIGHSDRFKAVVSMMGIYDVDAFHASTEELWFPEWDVGGTPWENPEAYAKWNPADHAKNFKTPTLVITGEKDYRIPYTQSLMLFNALRRQNVPARLIVFPDDGHWPNFVKSMPLYYAAHLDWFHKYLGGAPCSLDIKKMVQGRAFKEPEKTDK